MKVLLVIMTGIGFTLGVVFGLLLHLPTDSHPAQRNDLHHQQDGRFKRQADSTNPLAGNYEIKSDHSTFGKVFGHVDDAVQSLETSEWNSQTDLHANTGHLTKLKLNNADKTRSRKSGQHSLSFSKQTGKGQLDNSLSNSVDAESHGAPANPVFNKGLDSGRKAEKNDLKGPSLNSLSSLQSVGFKRSNGTKESKIEGINRNSADSPPSLEDRLYMTTIINNNVYWSEKAELRCRKPFTGTDTESWRTKVQGLDVVKMETGCGRMQNRLLTFRDSSKACARYRLNTDQIQGDIFSYYLAKLLNIPNLPPTILASVDSVDQKWRTVHLDLSLAQWADSKLVVLTKFIEGLKPAHIPKEFRDEQRQLFPILKHLGSKSQTELCELMQWSDLIIFDYLTANLDRVINNMFNSQWNDQMMSSPTHNLEQFSDGGLVFLDNESGLFHGFRLIDKYEKLHRALLDSVCVFRSSTADVIKRLATSGSVGKELRDLLETSEPLAAMVPSMPVKNVKILERRLQQVYKQIIKCEKEFHRL